MQTLLVTGGAGFIGGNFVLQQRATQANAIVTLDRLTYAGNQATLASLVADNHHTFVQGDICDRTLLDQLLQQYQPQAIVHFAAETHVDRSIDDPSPFIHSNIVGTYTLLEAARHYWASLSASQQPHFRFLQISTDEVFGSLTLEDPPFTETTPYAPNSPYAASKASADHLVRSYHHTFGLPTLITNCSNNYGPYQYPEKLIPLMILKALAGQPLPIYGDGLNIRDWLFVEDHCRAIAQVLSDGTVGETYNIGANSERTNRDIVHTLCQILDEVLPHQPYGPHAGLITYVQDRPGHDRRYAIDSQKLQTQVGWQPQETLTTGLRKTVSWYLAHQDWCQQVTQGQHNQPRMGLGSSPSLDRR